MDLYNGTLIQVFLKANNIKNLEGFLVVRFAGERECKYKIFYFQQAIENYYIFSTLKNLFWSLIALVCFESFLIACAQSFLLMQISGNGEMDSVVCNSFFFLPDPVEFPDIGRSHFQSEVKDLVIVTLCCSSTCLVLCCGTHSFFIRIP